MSDKQHTKESGVPPCDDCGCEEAVLVTYPGTFATPECKVWHCANCDKPLTQPE